MKWELEDLALRYLEPKAYYDLVDKVAANRQEREGRIEEARQTLEAALADKPSRLTFKAGRSISTAYIEDGPSG